VPDPNGGFIGDHRFELHVLGAGEQPGCATGGATVKFRIAGVPAVEYFSWVPFSDVTTFGQFQFIYLTAIRQHAWYWFEAPENEGPVVGTRVQAVIDGQVCGKTPIEGQGTGLVGFSRLLVPSAELQPGCGRAGAKVSFLFDGVRRGEPIEWAPGLHYINPLHGPPLFPVTGARPQDEEGWPSRAALVLALLGAVLLAASSVARRPSTGSG